MASSAVGAVQAVSSMGDHLGWPAAFLGSVAIICVAAAFITLVNAVK